MREINLSLMPYQDEFVYDLDTPILGLTGGMGSSKTVMQANKIIVSAIHHYGKQLAVLSPTYGMSRRNIFPELRKLNRDHDLGIEGLDTKNPTTLMLPWNGQETLIHVDLSMENHDRVNGLSLAAAFLDEIDKARPEDAVLAIEQVDFRLRAPRAPYPAQMNISTTPEGLSTMHSYFVTHANEYKKLLKLSTFDNYMLPPDYIERLKLNVPKHKHRAYFHGEFVSLTDGLVYKELDEFENRTDLTLANLLPTDNVWASFDLNYGGMSCSIILIRDGVSHVVKEYMGVLDTKELLENKLKKDPQLPIDRLLITCDPACTQALPIIKDSKLKTRIMSSAPEIVHSVHAMNERFQKRLLKINPKTCPITWQCFMTQQYLNGEPDKKTKVPAAKTDISGPIDQLRYHQYLLYPYNPKNGNKAPQLRVF